MPKVCNCCVFLLLLVVFFCGGGGGLPTKGHSSLGLLQQATAFLQTKQLLSVTGQTPDRSHPPSQLPTRPNQPTNHPNQKADQAQRPASQPANQRTKHTNQPMDNRRTPPPGTVCCRPFLNYSKNNIFRFRFPFIDTIRLPIHVHPPPVGVPTSHIESTQYRCVFLGDTQRWFPLGFPFKSTPTKCWPQKTRHTRTTHHFWRVSRAYAVP